MEVHVRPYAIALLAVTLVLPAGSAPAQVSTQGGLVGVVIAERQDEDEQTQLVISAPSNVDGRGVDEIRVKLDGNVARRLTVVYIPQGWESKADKNRLTLKGPNLQTPLVAVSYSAGGLQLPRETEIEIKSGGKRLFRAKITMGRMPAVNVATTLDDILSLPRVMIRDQPVSFRPLSANRTPAGGDWTAGGEPARWNGDLARPEYTFTPTLSWKLPLRLRYTDPWGETLVDAEVEDSRYGTLAAGFASTKPVITGCSPRTLVGKTMCVCGSFPDAASRTGISVNGTPIADYLVSSSSAVLNFKLPADFRPGPLNVVGHSQSGYGDSDTATSQLIGVGGDVDRNKLLRGESTPLRLWLVGTEEPLSLRLWNSTPAIISLEGGNDQIVTTAGGATNEVVKSVRGITPGDFVLHYSLTVTCPCAGQGPGWSLAKEAN